MKTYRVIDILVQALMLTTAIFFGIRSAYNSSSFELFSYSYFIIGSWQISSLLVHYFFATPTILNYLRTGYAKICLVIFILGLIIGGLFFLLPETAFFLVLYGYGLLWFTPVLVFFYFFICWKEYSLIVKKELIHLK